MEVTFIVERERDKSRAGQRKYVWYWTDMNAKEECKTQEGAGAVQVRVSSASACRALNLKQPGLTEKVTFK